MDCGVDLVSTKLIWCYTLTLKGLSIDDQYGLLFTFACLVYMLVEFSICI